MWSPLIDGQVDALHRAAVQWFDGGQLFQWQLPNSATDWVCFTIENTTATADATTATA